MFRPNWGPKGRKNVFENGHPPPPYLRIWMTGSSLLWRSGSATMVNAILGGPGADSRVGRKGGASLFKHGSKSPWVPTLTELFPKIQADAGSWLGTKNALYYCAQSANSFSRILFVSSYTTAIVLPHFPGSFTKLIVQARETFIFYFPIKPETKEQQMSRKNVWDAISRNNSICPENICDSSQCIVNNRKLNSATRKSNKQ